MHVEHGRGPLGERAGGVTAARPDRHLVVLAVDIALQHQARQCAIDQRPQPRIAQRSLVGREAGAARGVGECVSERPGDASGEAGRQEQGEQQEEQRDQAPEGSGLDSRLAAFHGHGR